MPMDTWKPSTKVTWARTRPVKLHTCYLVVGKLCTLVGLLELLQSQDVEIPWSTSLLQGQDILPERPGSRGRVGPGWCACNSECVCGSDREV